VERKKAKNPGEIKSIEAGSGRWRKQKKKQALLVLHPVCYSKQYIKGHAFRLYRLKK